MFKNFKNKKAASLMMVLWYSIILLWLAWLLVWMLSSSEKFVWISEKYNMAIYWAESWIEQGLYEINVHDIWFNDSTDWKSQNWDLVDNWFLKLNWDRLKYKWWVEWLNIDNSSTWFLVWNWNINYNYLNGDKNKKYYKNFRRFYMFKDTWWIWEDQNIENICKTDSTVVKLTTSWSNIHTDSDSDKTETAHRRLDFNEVNQDWTWYYLEANASCESNKKDPFCYTDLKTDYSLQFNSTENIWNCFNSFWDECDEQDVVQMLSDNNAPVASWNDVYKPRVTISYQHKLFKTWDSDEMWLPIKYEISWCNDNFPSLVQEITSTAQVYWSVQKISTKIYQWNQWIDLSYTVIQ